MQIAIRTNNLCTFAQLSCSVIYHNRGGRTGPAGPALAGALLEQSANLFKMKHRYFCEEFSERQFIVTQQYYPVHLCNYITTHSSCLE